MSQTLAAAHLAVTFHFTMTSLRRKRPRALRPSLYANNRQAEEPFLLLCIKVGSTILACCAAAYLAVGVFVSRKQSVTNFNYREHLLVKPSSQNTLDTKENEKNNDLPTFTLFSKSEHDAFGIAEQYLSTAKDDAPTQVLQFIDAAESLRQEFSALYGGESSARALLERSIVVLKKTSSNDESNSTTVTSALARSIHTAQGSGVLSMAFGGSSAVAGYGNFYHQSFPFIVENCIKEALELLGVSLRITNNAVEHTAIFPYTWCQKNYLGDDANVAMLDFGTMSIQQFESVLRNMLAGSRREAPIILVFRDSIQANERQSLLQR